MGRKTSNLTGIARFALQAFQEPVTQSAPTNLSQPIISESQPNSRPKKKRKTRPVESEQQSEADTWIGKYDATGLVSHYKKVSQVPPELRKYFAQRHRYFSLYDSGCLLDHEGWYSITPERIAGQIAERCRCNTILDAFCGVGGNAIAFAQTCERVIALDISPTRLALARHNAQIYGVADRIEFILADYVAFCNAHLSRSSPGDRKIDVVFLSPPWGGPSYLGAMPELSPPIPPTLPDKDANQRAELDASTEVDSVVTQFSPPYSLSGIQPIHGADLFKLSRRITPNIAYFLPRNTDLNEIASLIERADESDDSSTKEIHELLTRSGHEGEVDVDKSQKLSHQPPERVEVEEEWMGTKLKALTCYFGGLAQGQEELF